MFENPGGKIKSIVKTVYIIEVIVVAISAIVTWSNIGDFEGFLSFLLILALGIGVAYLSAIGLFAFGELVENSTIIAYNSNRASMPPRNIVQPQQPRNNPDSITTKTYQPHPKNTNKNAFWVCPTCHKENQMICGTCGCGTKRP